MKKKYYLLFLVAIVYLANSCTTITSRSRQYVEVDSLIDSVKVTLNDDSRTTYLAPTTIEVKPSKGPLILRISKDTVSKEIYLASQVSEGFFLGNLFWGLPGYLIDMSNSKKYIYPDYILLDKNLSVKSIGKDNDDFYSMKKHQVVCHISIPEGNYFLIDKGSEYGNYLGFFGMAMGIDYYVTRKLRLNVDLGGIMSYYAPFPTPFDFTKDRSASAAFIDLQLGGYVKRFHYDAGVQYTRTFFNDNSLENNQLTIQNTMGLAFSARYRFLPGFSFGVNYYPSFVTWYKGQSSFQYSHLLFLEARFSFNVYRPKGW